MPKKLSKSNTIRKMHDEGKSISQIAREMNTYYSFVHRVVKRYEEEGPPRSRPSKSSRIRDLFDEGKTVDEIVEQTGYARAMIYGVIKRYKEVMKHEAKV